jgi:hypothetical protein
MDHASLQSTTAANGEAAASLFTAQSSDDRVLTAVDVGLPKLPWEIITDDSYVQGDFVYSPESKLAKSLRDPHLAQAIPVEDNSDCLWTALREAMVHVGVPVLKDDLREDTLKYLSETGSKKELPAGVDATKLKKQEGCQEGYLEVLFCFATFISNSVTSYSVGNVQTSNSVDSF